MKCCDYPYPAVDISAWKEPVGEYADAMLRRVRRFDIELDAAKAVAKRAFVLARELYGLAPKDVLRAEHAIRLNVLCEDMVEIGVEVD